MAKESVVDTQSNSPTIVPWWWWFTEGGNSFCNKIPIIGIQSICRPFAYMCVGECLFSRRMAWNRFSQSVHSIPTSSMHSTFVFILSSSCVRLSRSSFHPRGTTFTAAPLCPRIGSRVVKWEFIGQFGFKSSLSHYYYVKSPLFFSPPKGGNWEADVQEHNAQHYYIIWWGWRRANPTNQESNKERKSRSELCNCGCG